MSDNRKVVIVTGGASGIGAATVKGFASEDCQVIIADKNEAASLQLKNSLISQFDENCADIFSLDVSKQDQVESMIAFAKERFGRLDILVNNAGRAGSGAVVNAPADHWQKVIDVNLNSVFWATQAALKIMLDQGSGSIVNVASISGLAGDYSFSSYNASKAAVINFTRSAALDHARDNIRINCVCPGAVVTPLVQHILDTPTIGDRALDAIPMGRGAEPEEIANVIQFLTSNQASFMTGAVIPVDGGMTAWSGQPKFF